MRKSIYVLCAFSISFLLGISFIYLIISLLKTYYLLGWGVVAFFLFAVAFLLTDNELIQEVDS